MEAMVISSIMSCVILYLFIQFILWLNPKRKKQNEVHKKRHHARVAFEHIQEGIFKFRPEQFNPNPEPNRLDFEITRFGYESMQVRKTEGRFEFGDIEGKFEFLYASILMHKAKFGDITLFDILTKAWRLKYEEIFELIPHISTYDAINAPIEFKPLS